MFGSGLPAFFGARALAFLAVAVSAHGGSNTKHFNGSVLALSAPGNMATLVRAELTPAELDANTQFSLPLAFRNLDELRARVARGERIAHSEMLARYLPTESAYAAVESWAIGEGLEVQPRSTLLLEVAARAKIRDVERSLHTTFHRVRGIDGVEYSSAATAPELPAEIAQHVVAVRGLQPGTERLRPHASPVVRGSIRYLSPATIREYYHATGFDGAGQTIAIMGIAIDPNDLIGFWAAAGVPQSISNVTTVNRGWQNQTVLRGPEMETTGDVEWSSAMAPAAHIRLYETIDAYAFAAALLEDMQTIPGLRQASLSFGSEEAVRRPDGTMAESQLYAALAAEGLTFFVASGDSGSNALLNLVGGYDPNGPPAVQYPASDPCVVAVGGTLMALDGAGGMGVGEISYAAYGPDGKVILHGFASGGGISAFFARPVWQSGPGVPGTAMRCIPDVSSVWGADQFPAYLFFNGSDSSFGGTSLSAPLWAGLCALLNQARANAGKPALGLLGPRIYPLIGTDAFNDVVVGNNGAYDAGRGFDLCSGIGSPNIAKLAIALTNQAEPPAVAFPAFSRQPETASVAPGQTATFTVQAQSTDAMSYQWVILAPGKTLFADLNSSDWAPLSDDATYSGTHTATLTIANAATTLNGAIVMCRVINSYGVALSLPALLGVSANKAPLAPIFVRSQYASVVAGKPATLEVVAIGTPPLSYQWLDGIPSHIAGATTASLHFDAAQPDDAGAYSVNVSNAAGGNTIGTALYVLTSPTLLNNSTVGATLNQPFSYQLVAANNMTKGTPSTPDYTSGYSARGLPPGLTLNSAIGRISGTPTAAGTYPVSVSATNDAGTDAMELTFIVAPAGAPTIVASPRSIEIGHAGMPGTGLRFEVAATGGDLKYQWLHDNVPLTDAGLYSGTTTSVLEINQAQPEHAGSYVAVVSNDRGTATSDPATLTIDVAPAIVVQPPHLQTVVAGTTVWLNMNAEGNGRTLSDGLLYQWKLDGVDIPGATKSALCLPRAGRDQVGGYSVTVRSGSSTKTSTISQVEVVSDSRPINISTRAWVGSGDNSLFAGFAIEGTAPKRVLIRAAGPALAPFNIDGRLTDPKIELHDGHNEIIGVNDNWSDDPAKADAIAQAAATAGAFGFPRGSKDAVLLMTLDPGTYSAVVTGADGGSGVAIAEVYDADTSNHLSTLSNVSSRSFVQGGDKTMIAGFVIDGTQPHTVLIRASGPGIAQFGVPSTLTDPVFEIRAINQHSVIVGSNDSWSADPNAAMAMRIANKMANAFGFALGSKDSGQVITLSPGAYSVVVRDAAGGNGNSLVEVYDLR